MHKLNEKGSLLPVLVVLAVLLFGALGFGGWAFMSRQDYKDNSDKKAELAVEAAVKAEDAKKDAEFAEKEKSPSKTYTAPTTYGSISFSYPKTWDAYISESVSDSQPIDGYFSPNFVPDLKSGNAFALRVRLVSQSYEVVMKQFDSNVSKGVTTAAAYRPEKVNSALGSKLSGTVFNSKLQSTAVVLPVRDKTLEIWTEGVDFTGDFDSVVLPSLNFAP